MRLLVVEDEKKVASFIKQGLEEEGYAVDVALDGEKGLDMALLAVQGHIHRVALLLQALFDEARYLLFIFHHQQTHSCPSRKPCIAEPGSATCTSAYSLEQDGECQAGKTKRGT